MPAPGDLETKEMTMDKKKILVVDDNPVVLKSMAIMLNAAGYHTMVALSGSETIGWLNRERPDLILMDLDFAPDPEYIGGALRDGFLIIDWARRFGIAEKIPVIIVSGLDPERYKDRAASAGIPIFLRKPVDREKLLEAVRTEIAKSPRKAAPPLNPEPPAAE